MRPILLIGAPSSKRTRYFMEVAQALGRDARVLSLEKATPEALKGYAVKIDPVEYGSMHLSDLEPAVTEYCSRIMMLQQAAGAVFLNTPAAVCSALDKIQAKKILEDNSVSTTPRIPVQFAGFHQLHGYLLDHRTYRVFLKPNLGSGAMGVLACRFSPDGSRCLLETSLQADRESRLVNSRILRKITDKAEAAHIIDAVLAQPCIVERWIPKSSVNGVAYDLRVLVQFGRVEYTAARGSKGAITNLDLNNHSLSLPELGLPEEALHQAHQLALKAVAAFEGLRVAGVDVLLEAGTLKPYVVEVNGQGDLIHRSIYGDNEIYKNQIKELF